MRFNRNDEKDKTRYRFAQSIQFTAKVKEWIDAYMEGRMVIRSQEELIVAASNRFERLNPLEEQNIQFEEDFDDEPNLDLFI